MLSKYKLLIVIPLLALSACVDDEPGDADKPTLVVEGYFDANGFPNVFVTFAASPSTAEKSIADNLVRWGKVTVSDGTDSIILTGSPTKRHFPPYYYRTFEMVGTAGKTYRLTVDYKGYYAEATATMPEVTKIDKVEFEPIADNDRLCATYIRFRSPDDVPAYYVVYTRSVSNQTMFQPCMLGVVEVSEPHKDVRLQVYRAKTSLKNGSVKYVPHFEHGEIVGIKLSRVEKPVYDFWRGYSNYTTFGNSQFLSSTTSLPTNIIGGIGIWSVQASSTVECNVP